MKLETLEKAKALLNEIEFSKGRIERIEKCRNMNIAFVDNCSGNVLTNVNPDNGPAESELFNQVRNEFVLLLKKQLAELGKEFDNL